MGTLTVLGIPHSLGEVLDLNSLKQQLTEAAQKIIGKKALIVVHVVPEFDSSYAKGDPIVTTVSVDGFQRELTRDYSVADEFEKSLTKAMKAWVKAAPFPDGLHVDGQVCLPSLHFEKLLF